jgi:hypothetical protein
MQNNMELIEYLKDTLYIGYSSYETSKQEAMTVWDLYHNNHYTDDQLNILAIRGQPAETFNLIKMFSRLLLGYYSTVVNKITIQPVAPEDAITSSLLNDVVDHVLRDNYFMDESEKIKLEGLLSGVMCSYIDVQPTGNRDEFGRPMYRVALEAVPESELVLDPLARRSDYSDARFIHRYRWLSEEAVIQLFGQAKADQLTEYYNFTQVPVANYDLSTPPILQGLFRMHNMYLVVHSVLKDYKGKAISIYWHDNIILQNDEITYKDVKFPYRVVLTHHVNHADKTEYYGIFRDIIELQKAINQALIKLQLLLNTQKAFVEENAVENLADFTHAFNRVTAVIPVLSLKGIRIENLAREAQEQYVLIDRALDRAQRILGINDSFLGLAYASDSGRKVKLQQNAAVIALRYFTGRVECFYRLLGQDIVGLVKQYYTATQALRITDDYTGTRWSVINQPQQRLIGMNPDGTPAVGLAYEEVLDPATGKPLLDEAGNYVIAPMPTADTDISFTNADIEVTSAAYNDEDERNQLMVETILAGGIGQMLASVNPAGFFKVASLNIKALKTKYAPEIASIFEQTMQMLQSNQQGQQQAQNIAMQNTPEAYQMMMAQGGMDPMQQASMAAQNSLGIDRTQPRSRSLKLPQNTNE